jgi:hypothetical protein
MYDLLEWIKDEKSSQSVFLAGNLAELRVRYLGELREALCRVRLPITAYKALENIRTVLTT